MRAVGAPLKILLTLVIAAAVALVAAGLYGWTWLGQPFVIDEERVVTLRSGQSFAGFAAELEADGILHRARVWTLIARLSGDARSVQAGEYRLDPGDTPAVLMDRLLNGQVVTYEVKLIEGWTVAQALAELARQPALEQTLSGASVTTLLGALGLPGGNAEGLFFPDTYRYERGATDAGILRRAYRKLEAELQAVWTARDAGLPY